MMDSVEVQLVEKFRQGVLSFFEYSYASTILNKWSIIRTSLLVMNLNIEGSTVLALILVDEAALRDDDRVFLAPFNLRERRITVRDCHISNNIFSLTCRYGR